MKQVTAELLQEIVRRLVETLHPEQIILFGSHAYGQPNEDSDVDLLVIVSESDEPSYRRAQTAHGALWGIGVPKDVIVMTRNEVDRSVRVKTSLVHQALAHGKVLYG